MLLEDGNSTSVQFQIYFTEMEFNSNSTKVFQLELAGLFEVFQMAVLCGIKVEFYLMDMNVGVGMKCNFYIATGVQTASQPTNLQAENRILSRSAFP
jgi:hypothetical protein